MNAHSVPVAVMAGITLYVGLYHLFLYFRLRQHRWDLMFGLTCLVVSAYDVVAIGLYHADSVAEGVEWQRWQIVLLGLSAISLIFFLSDYTARVSRRWRVAMVGYFVVMTVVNLFDRSPLTWSAEASIKHVIRWGWHLSQ